MAGAPATGCPDDPRSALALKSIDLAKAALLADSPFLAAAIGRLHVQPMQLQAPLATDGHLMAFDAQRLLDTYVREQQPPSRSLLHTVAHCLFLHPYVGPSVERALWDLACDIAVERVVAEVLGPRPGAHGVACLQVVERIERALGGRAHAERIYAHLKAGEWEEDAGQWAQLFASDSHELWHASAESPGEGTGQGDSSGNAATNQQRTQREGAGSQLSSQQQQDAWRNVATSLAVDLQTTSARRGVELGGFVDDLQAEAQPRVDYAAFLRRFAQPGEALRINDEEFDQVFYTYGLQLYGDTPLVEPLEYREERRIREFVIAIDTSESVQGDAIRQFVATTFDLLKTTEAFFERINLRILQCDMRVTSDVKVSSPAELDRWQRTMRVAGGGGTDFRPAFAYVDQLVEEGQFRNPGGMIYFTDGLGTYPEWVPSYPVAFVFYDEDLKPDDVPPWAYQVRLDEGALQRAAVRTVRG